MQQLLQRTWEAAVDELLARCRYERAAIDAPAGYRNGYGKPRRLSLSNGTILLRRPRVRGLSAQHRLFSIGGDAMRKVVPILVAITVLGGISLVAGDVAAVRRACAAVTCGSDEWCCKHDIGGTGECTKCCPR